MLHFSLLAFAGYCGKLREAVRAGLIIRRPEIRALVGPPIKTIIYEFPARNLDSIFAEDHPLTHSDLYILYWSQI